jgi:beta-lactamase class D
MLQRLAPLLFLATACAPAPAAAPAPASSQPAAAKPPVPTALAIDHPGCFLLEPLAGGERIAVHPEECAHATVPASTFKVPHALVALQTGVVDDPDAIEKWNGADYPIDAWERDHSLRTAITESVVWFFQRTATRIGRERMATWLGKLDYGNAQVTGELTKFWLDGGSLAVTGDEQMDFFARMFRHELPIDPEHVELVETILAAPIEQWAGRLPEGETPPATKATLRAKTGTDSLADGSVTWWVGEVDGPRGKFVFVSRVRAPEPPGRASPAVREGMRALAQAGVL